MRKWISLLFFTLVTVSCGSSSNFNQLWPSDEGTDQLLVEAQVKYDQGEFSAAESLALKAVGKNPNHLDAAVLLGYIYLSLGGVDTYQLAEKLNGLNSSSSTALQSSKKSGANDTLADLSSIINVTDADIAKLGTSITTLAEEDKDVTLSSDIFEESDVFVPKDVDTDLRNSVSTLSYMNKAILAICRFVDSQATSDDAKVKTADNTRHASSDCDDVEDNGKPLAQAHFLWAFTHLTEALVFQQVLLYASDSVESQQNNASDSNFANAAGSLDASQLTTFANQVSDLNTAMNLVFNTSSEQSMISETLVAIDSVNKAFGQMAGLPESMTSSISESMQQITSLGDTLGGGTSNNTKALKGELTQDITKSVGTKVDEAANKEISSRFPGKSVDDLSQIEQDDPAKFNELKTEMSPVCNSYNSLADGADTSKQKKPAVCQAIGV